MKVQQFEEINRALDKCCDLALQQPITIKQIALMTDASFGAAGYAVLIKDDPNQKFTAIRKSNAPVAYGSKRQRYYYHSMAKHVKKWVGGCERCAKDKRVPNATITHERLNLPEWDLGPEDAMQIDLLPNLLPSGTINVAKVLIDIMTKHAYLPTTLITDKGTAFTSTIIAEITQILGITLKCATTEHSQTIEKLERIHASLKTNLKMPCGEFCRQSHKYLPLAVLNHNTSYHASTGCEPTRVFHRRVPYNILDHQLGNNPNEQITPTTEFAEEIQNGTKLPMDKTKQKLMQSYIKPQGFYDRKANATPLKEGDYCFVLQPKADNQGSKIPFKDYCWFGPFIIQKVLPNENYIVRRLKTNKTQIMHRIRLKKFAPNQLLEDNFREELLQQDEEIVIPQDDLYTVMWETNFGDEQTTRGNEPIPTSLPFGEQPITAETNSNDAYENEDDYIITTDTNEDHALKDAGPGSRRKTWPDTGTSTVPTGDNQGPCRA